MLRFRKLHQLSWSRLVLSMLVVPAILVVIALIGMTFQNADRNFSKGVLALNTDKSAYAPGEAVLLQMASLDKNGDTLCDSNLQLNIDVPKKWRNETISSDQIQRSPTCDPSNNVTNEPDYLARFIATTPGKYQLTLKNTANGKRVKTSFTVSENAAPVRISRSSATRINPFKSDRYPMIITVTANEDFRGKLTETLPKDFKFAWIGPATSTQTRQHQVLTWDVELKAGENKEFAYEYDAPDKSPDFIRLGELEAKADNGKRVFTETRVWQIASDATGEGMLVVDPNGRLQEAPHYREWTTTDLAAEGDMVPYAHTTTIEDVNFTIVEAASTRNEYVRGTLSEFGHLDIQVYNGSTWAEATGSNPTINNGELTTGIGGDNALFRGFDIAYEDSTGDALVVYEDSTTANGTLKYRTWNGTAWSDEATLDYTAADESADVAVWVELQSDVGSDNIMAAWHDKANDTILGAVWDGSAWQDITQLTGAGLPETHGQTFDAAWEATSGEGMVAYGTGTITAYRVYTVGSGFAAAGASPANPGEAVNWLSLAGDWDTDYIALMINSSAGGIDVGTADASADIWNGTDWTTITGPTEDSDTNSPGYSKGSDVMWEPTGDRALFVYRDGATSETLFRYFLYDISANQWQVIDDNAIHCTITEGAAGYVEVVTTLNAAEDAAAPCTINTYAVAGNITGITMAANPASSQIMVVQSNETALGIRPELMRWNGDANGTWLTQTATMGAPETDNSPGTLPLLSYRYLAYDFAFRDSGADSTGLYVYDEDGANNVAPRYRTWSGTDLGSEASLNDNEALADADESLHSIVVAAPTRDEYVAGMLTASGTLVVQVWNGSSWGYGTGAPTNGVFESGIGLVNAAYRGFDIAYENSTGDALVVFEDSTTANGTLKYRTWNGTTWSGESTLDYTAADESADVAVWVELESDVGSDNILAAWHDKANETILGARWDGSAWQNITQITGAGIAETNGQTFDVAWEATSGEGMVAYGTGTITAYRVYTPGSGFAAAGASPANPGEAVNWLSLAGDWDTDYIAMIISSGNSTSTSDALPDMWNGSDWTTISNPTEDTDTNNQGYAKGSDVMWEPTGDRALFVFRDGPTGETVIRYFLYDISANQWQAIEDGTHCALTEGATGYIETVTSLNLAEDSAGPCTHATAFAGNVTGITLAANPANSQIMVVASNELTLPIRPELLRWNGDANGSWLTQTATMGAPELEASMGELPLAGWPVKAYDFAFNIYTPAATITISGTIRQTDESTAYDCSAVTAVTVHSSTNGGANQSVDCTVVGGTYSITTAVDPGAANIPVAVFIDSAEGIKGTTVTLSLAGATNITGLDIIVDRVTVTQESATAITNAHLATADNANAGIRYAVSGGNLTVESPMELHVRTTETFTPGGNVTTDKLHVVGTYTGGAYSLTLLGSGTTTARPLYINGGTFTAPTTTIFQGTSATDIESTTYNALSLTPTITGATTYTLLGAETINGNFTINPTAGTTQLLTVNAGGTITVGAAYTTTISGTTSGTSTLDLRPVSTDYNLSTGKLDIATAGTLDATSTTAATITLTATTSTLFTRSGTFTAGGSTVVFNPDAAVTLTSGTFTGGNAFYNLSLTPAISSAGRTYTFGAGAIETTGDFLIQPSGTQLLTVAMAGNITVANNKTTTITRSDTATSSLVTGASNPALSSGSITIATGGTLEGASPSSTSVITLTANGTPFTRTGTYNPGSTTIAYVPASTTGVTVTSGTYYNVTFNKASNTFSLAASGITVTNDLTITAGVLDTVSGSNYPIAVGRNWTNTPGTGGFLAQNGTVTFNTTTAAAITGATIFYNFTATTAPKEIDFGDATTFRINGALTLTGSAGPNYITLDSVTGGSTQWTINHQGTESISYSSVKNSACDGSSTSITADNGTNFNAGNNGVCWVFPASSTASSSVWKFDEGFGTDAHDATGNDATAVLAGTTTPTWQSEEMCISGKCVYFDGTTAKVTVADTVDTKTVSLWVRPTSDTTTILQLTATDYISATSGTLAASGFTGTFYVNGVQTNTIVANRWQHVVVTTGTSISADTIILGNNSTNYFKGFMDEVKLISTEYTAAQVKGEFAKRGSVDEVAAQFGDASVGQQLSDGLVGYWKMDEASGTAADASGNTYTLTNNGTTTFVTGKFGKGSEHVPSTQFFSTASSLPSTLSISFWTNPDALTNYYVNLSSTANIQTNSSGVIAANGFTNPKIYVNGVEGTTLVANQWQLVTVTSTAPITTDAFTIGKVGASNYFDGTMDEVRLYNRMLDAREVATIYAYAPAPVGYWKMDENTGTSIADISGNGGTLSTTSGPGFVSGKFGSALSLVGSSSQYASRTDTAPLSQTGNLTLSTWIKPSAVTAATLFPITSKSTTTTISYMLAQYGDEIRMYIGSSANFVTTNASNLSANNWYHVEAVYTASAQTVDIYINGVKAAATTTGTIPTSISDGTDDFAVGYYSSGSGGTTLSPVPEVAASTDDGYQNTTGLVGNVTGTEVHLGNGSNALISGFRFTGIGITQGATITSATFKPTSQDTYTCSGCTLSVNVKMEDTDDAATFSAADSNISSRTTTTAQTTWNIASFTADVQYSVDVTDAVQEVVDRGGWASGNDMAVLVVDNGSTTAEWQNIYSWDHATGTPAQLTITYGSGSSSYYDGAIDDVKLYNYTRTQSQVIEDMNGNHPVGGSPIGSQVAYWKLDEGNQTTLYDTTPNANNVTLQTGAWTTSGQFGNALDFESGSSNYATLADNAALSLTGSMTLSAWIKPESTTAATNFPIVAKGVSYALTQYGDELRMYVGSESNYKTTSAVDLQVGTWYHVQGVYNAISQTVTFYVNGVEYSGSVTGTIPASISDGASAFDIGRLYTGVSYQFPVTATADDGIQTDVTGWFNNQNYDGFGFYTTAYNNTHAGLRFQDITIGQGTTVSNAYISVYGNTANSVGSATSIDVDIYGDNVDSAGAWVNGSSMPSGTGMTDTSAVVAWNPSTWSNGWINTPDISSIVQEILNRGGWASGNEMRFAIRNASTTDYNVMAFEDMQLANGRQAVLNITTGSSTTYYDGVIDEIKVYSSALTAAQAQTEYVGGKSISLGATSTNSSGTAQNGKEWSYCPPGFAASCVGPAHEYLMDENNSSTVYDTGSSSTRLDGTLTLGTTFISGKFGSGSRFDGTDSYISFGAGVELYQETDPFTFSFWLYPDNPSHNAPLIEDNSDDYTALALVVNGWSGITNGLSYCGGGACSNQATTKNNVITMNRWQQVSLTYDGTSECRFYVNGIDVTNDSTCGEAAGTYTTRIGGNTTTPNSLEGSMDQMRIYDYARTPAQIAWEYSQGKPVAWYKMDEGADTVINDSSGNGFTGTLTLGGSPTTATAWANGAAGKINSSMDFDGTDDMVTVADPATDALDFANTNFAISGWFNRDTFTTDDVIVAKRTGDANTDDGYLVYIDDATDQLVFEVSESDGADEYSITSTSTFTTSGWNHFTVVWDDVSAANSEIYINGKADNGTDSGTIGSIGTLVNTSPLRIGDVSDGVSALTTHFFDGKIDDVRIFNYAPTPQQVRDVYNNGAVSFR